MEPGISPWTKKTSTMEHQSKKYEYALIKIYLIPGKIVDQYNLIENSANSWVYMEIIKGIPGLKQSRKIAHDWFKTHLTQFDYHLMPMYAIPI